MHCLLTPNFCQVEKFKNPEIPFKLSHMGNTLYVPAMFPLCEVSDLRSGGISTIKSNPSPIRTPPYDVHRRGSGLGQLEKNIKVGTGDRSSKVGYSGPNAFEKMFAYEKSRPATSSGERIGIERIDGLRDASRPSTGFPM